MDILAHGLWTNLAYYKKYKYDLKNRLWAVFFGIMPDLVSFTPSTLYVLLSRNRFNLEQLISSSQWTFFWARESYNYTHSLISLAVVAVLILLVRRGKMYWPILGWLLHIVIDIFTHPNFYSTPFLYPLSGFKNRYGISWAEPHFMAINYGALAILYILIFTVWKKKKNGQPS